MSRHLRKGAEATPELYNLLGISYMQSGQYEKAADSFETGSPRWKAPGMI